MRIYERLRTNSDAGDSPRGVAGRDFALVSPGDGPVFTDGKRDGGVF